MPRSVERFSKPGDVKPHIASLHGMGQSRDIKLILDGKQVHAEYTLTFQEIPQGRPVSLWLRPSAERTAYCRLVTSHQEPQSRRSPRGRSVRP